MHNGTPAGQWASAFRLVDNGDAADANEFNTPYQDALDRTDYLKSAVYGVRSSPVSMWSYDGANITLNGQAALALSTRTVGLLGASTTFNAAVQAGVANLSFNTWYYVYAVYSGGFSILVSAEVPKGNLRYALSSDDEGYLGCFRSNAVGNIVPFTCHGGHYSYDLDFTNINSDTVVLVAGTSLAAADVVLQKAVPPHVRLADLYLNLHNVPGGNASALLQRKGDGITAVLRHRVSSTAGDFSTGSYWMNTDASQTVQYSVSIATAALDIAVRGFKEQ